VVVRYSLIRMLCLKPLSPACEVMRRRQWEMQGRKDAIPIQVPYKAIQAHPLAKQTCPGCCACCKLSCRRLLP